MVVSVYTSIKIKIPSIFFLMSWSFLIESFVLWCLIVNELLHTAFCWLRLL